MLLVISEDLSRKRAKVLGLSLLNNYVLKKVFHPLSFCWVYTIMFIKSELHSKFIVGKFPLDWLIQLEENGESIWSIGQILGSVSLISLILLDTSVFGNEPNDWSNGLVQYDPYSLLCQVSVVYDGGMHLLLVYFVLKGFEL